MISYYIALQTKSHALLLERRLKQQGIKCELAFMPRPIMKDLCNMGIKLPEGYFDYAVPVIKCSGLPGFRVYKEILTSTGGNYIEVKI